MSYTILIANKRYSSWSLRAWLALRIAVGKDNFQEKLLPLPHSNCFTTPTMIKEAESEYLKQSPTAKVPILIDDDLGVTVCESLGIILHIADRFPSSNLFPVSPKSKAECISACARMHTGYPAIRENLGMNTITQNFDYGKKSLLRDDVQAEIASVHILLESLLSNNNEGPFLFGKHFSAADCMFAPFAFRFKSYDDPSNSILSSKLNIYFQHVREFEPMQEWLADSLLEGNDLMMPKYEPKIIV
jgi:glutathione S-transferase